MKSEYVSPEFELIKLSITTELLASQEVSDYVPEEIQKAEEDLDI